MKLRAFIAAVCAVLWLAVWAVSPAGSGSLTLLGAGGGPGVAPPTNFLLADSGSVLLVDTGVKFLVQ